jgi:uncharacterized caspase-like protein
MNEKDSAKVGEYILDEKSRKLPRQGKYILSFNQTLQEAYALTSGEHSIFTYYLLAGLRGNTESIDSDGNVTPQSLGNYVYRKIISLPSADDKNRRICKYYFSIISSIKATSTSTFNKAH